MFNNKEKELFYHEDDYLQVEIIPKNNLFERNKVLFDMNYESLEYGFSNIGARNIKNKPTSFLEINLDELKKDLKLYSSIEFNKTYSGYSSNSTLKKNIASYGFED